jgi:N-methylhydantoinase B
VPPHGFGGGLPPSVGDFYLMRATNLSALLEQGSMPHVARIQSTREITPSKVSRVVFSRGDIFVTKSGGGGGLGDPLLRDPEAVARDVHDGYITVDHAGEGYGVVLDPASAAVDVRATAMRRSDVRRARIGREPQRVSSPPASTGVSICREHDGDGERWVCGYCGHTLGHPPEDWRDSDAVVVRKTGIAERFAGLGMAVRERREPPQVILVESFCGECAGALAAETSTDPPPG